ncbi:MAG: hypothetical protein HY864_07140 [Chloroflexi bacterium]|nr:hypothetical protein [Chloroflexota bacterium]
MKKMRFVWIILSIAAMLASVAAAPLAGTALTLIEVRNDKHGDVIFVFSVSGHFSKSELKGYVQVQGEDANYDLSCSQVDDVTVQCTTSRKTGGKNVVVFFGGSVFWAFVPPTIAQYCYNVYDIPWPPEGGTLVAFTTYCQDAPANYGDVINLYNPEWDFNYDYEFLPESPICYDVIIENAFYWNRCLL